MIFFSRFPRGPALGAASAALSAALLAAPLAGTAGAAEVQRLQGDDAVSAALAWSTFSFAAGATDTVLLARDDVFADALASGSAQGRLDAPLLLTNGDVLDPRTLAEINRLGAQRVLILGGEEAISPVIEQTLTTMNLEVTRHAGATRIETAIAVAQDAFPTATQVVVARAYGTEEDETRAFADTLATGNYAAAAEVPILFTESNRLTASTRAYLESSAVEFITVAGGVEAISDEVVAELEAILEAKGANGAVTRLAGANRFSTAVAMNAGLNIPTAGEADRVILIDGSRSDAWASGFAAAIQSTGSAAAVVLANGEGLPSESADYLADAGGRIPLVCGPFTTTAACDAAAAAMGNA